MPIEGINLSLTMKTGFLPVDINDGRIMGSASAADSWVNSTATGFTPGGFLSTLSTPKLTMVSTAVRQLCLDWTSGSAVGVMFPQIVLPPDFTSLSAPVLNILAGRAAAASSDTSPAWNVNLYPNNQSSVAAVNLPVTNITSSVATLYTAAVSTVQISVGYPGTLGVTVAPASSQDEPKLYALWLTYTRAQRG
jgi:hypothetical protein